MTNSDNPQTTPSTGRYTTAGIPHGTTSITPHLAVSNPAEALAFYRDVFGATIESVTQFGDVLAHASLLFPAGRLTLSSAMEDLGLVPFDNSDRVSVSFALAVPNIDEVTQAALAAGATLREKPMDFVSGDRYASILDPFGVRWTIVTRVEDLSPEESDERVRAWAATQ